MNWLYGLTLAVVVAGFVSGINLLKSMRAAKYTQAVIAWVQPPVSYWKYETTSMISIAITDAGLTCLALILLVSSANSDIFAYFTKSAISLLLSLLSLFGIAVSTYSIGLSFAFHFARGWIRPVSYAISDEGLLYGRQRVSWESFSHYEIGPDDGLVSLYSSYSPSIRTWVLNPPPEIFSRVLGILQQNLPPSPLVDSLPSWGHSPFVLILGVAFMALIANLPAIWGFWQGQSWTWVYTLMAFFIVQNINGQIMNTFDGRGKYPSQPAMTK